MICYATFAIFCLLAIGVFICYTFEYYSLFNIVNCQMCEELIHRHTCVVILLIEYYVIMWIMYTVL